jgi:hypothetical protein
MATYTVYLSFLLGKGGSVSWAYPNDNDFSHTTGTSSNPLDVAPGDTVNFVEVADSTGGGTVTGPSGANLTIFGATTSFSYSAGDGIGTAASLTVGSGSDTTQQLVAAPSGGGTTDSFYIRRETPPVTGTIKFGTTTSGGTDSIITDEPDGGVQFTANINTTGTYYWDLERTNTSIGSSNRFSFSSPTSGSFSATANTDITPITTGGPSTNVGNNHWGYQGIGFTVDLFTGASRTGTLLDSINWTIYEDTSGISNINAGTGASLSNFVTECIKQPLENSTFGVVYKLTHLSTSQGVVTSQCSTVSTRLRNITNGTTAAVSSVAVGSYTATSQPTGNYSFTATSPSTTGNRETFQVQLFNGNEWINNGGLNFVLAFEPAANTQVANQTITLADRLGGYTVSITNSDTTANDSEVYSISTTDHGAGGNAAANTNVTGDRINNSLEASVQYARSTTSGTTSFGIPEADIPTSGSQTYYVYAYRRSAYSGEQVYYKRDSFTLTIQTNDPDIDVTETSAREILPGATSHTMTFSNGTSGDEYQLRHYDGGAQTGTIVNSTPATADGSGNFSISLASGDLPASNTANTKWYSLYARRPIANGGDNQYDYCSGSAIVNTLNITRRPLPPSITTSDNDAASDNVGIILNVTNSNSFTPNRIHLYQYKNAVLINSVNRTFTVSGNYDDDFTQPRDTGADTYYYRGFLQDTGVATASATPEDNMTGSSSLSTITQSDYQPGYIAPDVSVSASNITTNTINGNNQTINISGKNALDSVRILRTSPSSLDCGNTGTGATTGSVLLSGEGAELPSVGSVFSYRLEAERPAASGGDDAFDIVTSGTNNTFSIGRLNNFAFASPGTVSGGTTYYQNDQITGIVGSLTVSHSGDGDFAVSSSATVPSAASFSTASKSISNNEYVHVRSTAGIAEGNTETTTISINGQSANFVVTTPYNSTLYDIDVSFNDFTEIGEVFLTLFETNGDVPGTNPSWGDFQPGDQVRFNHVSGSDFTTFTLSSIDTNFWTYGSTSAAISRGSSLTLTIGSGSSPSSDTLSFGGEGTASFSRTTVSTPTYALSAGSSAVNEGTSNTITVTTTQVTNGTVLYWGAGPFTDFTENENTNNEDIGTVTINNNTGSFSVTPLADSATEGAETATVTLYTNSARTTSVANVSFTINDTSQGGTGGGTSGGTGSDAYGLAVYFGSPQQVVFGSNLRATNLLAVEENVSLSGASTLNGTDGGTQSFTGIADATDVNKTQVVLDVFTPNTLTILRSTANGGTITVRNEGTGTVNNLDILVFRLS